MCEWKVESLCTRFAEEPYRLCVRRALASEWNWAKYIGNRNLQRVIEAFGVAVRKKPKPAKDLDECLDELSAAFDDPFFVRITARSESGFDLSHMLKLMRRRIDARAYECNERNLELLQLWMAIKGEKKAREEIAEVLVRNAVVRVLLGDDIGELIDWWRTAPQLQ